MYSHTGCSLHNSWGPSFTDYFVDVAPGTVQGHSPTDSPKANCLKRKMQKSEVRGFKAPG